MNSKAWRTVIVGDYDSLSTEDEQLILENGEKRLVIPISQIRLLMLSTDRGSMSLPLISKLLKQNTSIIFCDGKRTPIGETSAIGLNYDSAGKHLDQMQWTVRKKNALWRQIVYLKIRNQQSLLRKIGNKKSDLLSTYLKSIETGDVTNREAVAAKMYFDLLFGADFIRFAEDDINSALNYGYTIIRNAFVRAIVSYGYDTEVGIHHCSRENRFNLASDLMEPFRPFVDEVVYSNIGRTLDVGYKRELISILNQVCLYDEKRVDIDTAISEFVLDATKYMGESRKKLKEIQFDKKG